MKRYLTSSLIISLVLVFVFSSLVLSKQFEGPVPEKFNEAPELKKLVAEGELEPVEERLPEDPYVVDVKNVGEYGGTLQEATGTLTGWGEHVTVFDFISGFVKPDKTAGNVVPNLASKIESSEDKTTFTIYLRKGVKWSDGTPFTTDDIMFWYNDILLNKDLTPTISNNLKSDNGKVMKLKILDDYTFQVQFDQPKIFYLNSLIHDCGWNYIFPKHYLKNFHPNYVPEEELNKKVKEAGFDHWYEFFAHKNQCLGQVSLTPERPTLTAYRLVNKDSNKLVFERNPYYWKVDTAGNQLPYIDGIYTVLATDKEVINGKIMSGEIDFASRNVDIRNYPMYKNYEQKGGFKTYLWRQTLGSEIIYMVNMTHEDPVLRKIFQDVRFRRALSLAINRDEINDAIYFGKAEPRAYTVLEGHPSFEPGFATAYIDYDPERANDLLDEMGLTDSDGDGYRERPDGKPLSFTIEITNRPYPVVPNVEIVTSNWQEIGINVNSKMISGELAEQRAPANLMDACIWGGAGATGLRFPAAAGTMFVPYRYNGSNHFPSYIAM